MSGRGWRGAAPAGLRGVPGLGGLRRASPAGGCGRRLGSAVAARRCPSRRHRRLQSPGWCPPSRTEMPGLRGEGMEGPLRVPGSRESGSRRLPGLPALPLHAAVPSLALRPLGTARARAGANAAGETQRHKKFLSARRRFWEITPEPWGKRDKIPTETFLNPFRKVMRGEMPDALVLPAGKSRLPGDDPAFRGPGAGGGGR